MYTEILCRCETVDALLAQKTAKDYERESRNRLQRLQELIKEVNRLHELVERIDVY